MIDTEKRPENPDGIPLLAEKGGRPVMTVFLALRRRDADCTVEVKYFVYFQYFFRHGLTTSGNELNRFYDKPVTIQGTKNQYNQITRKQNKKHTKQTNKQKTL